MLQSLPAFATTSPRLAGLHPWLFIEMSYPSFILFKEARQFQTGYLDLLWDVKVFTFQKRDYHFVGQCVHFCQITDEKNRLVGFVCNYLTDDVPEQFVVKEYFPKDKIE